jgi:hypothetical protein
MYLGRVGQERKCRLAGDIIGADFYLRQLTHMEVMLEFGGALKYILWDCEGGTSDGSKSVYGTEVTEELDRMRREAWAEAGDPDRPRMINNRTELPNYIVGGPDIYERQALLEDATSRAAEAQRMLEEALADQVYAKTGERYDRWAGRGEGEGESEGDAADPVAGV